METYRLPYGPNGKAKLPIGAGTKKQALTKEQTLNFRVQVKPKKLKKTQKNSKKLKKKLKKTQKNSKKLKKNSKKLKKLKNHSLSFFLVPAPMGSFALPFGPYGNLQVSIGAPINWYRKLCNFIIFLIKILATLQEPYGKLYLDSGPIW